MGLFKRQKEIAEKAEVIEVVEPKVDGEYPEIVQEIHSSFYTAAEKVVEEAEKYEKEICSRDVQKGLSLSDLGFAQAQQVEEAIDTEKNYKMTSEQVKLINLYRVRYPKYKFITENQVEQVCKKYGLIMGGVGLYKGFVPDKNREEILEFKGIWKEDKYDCEIVTNQGQVIDYLKYESIISEHAKKKVKEGGDYFVQFTAGDINVEGGEAKWGRYSRIRQYDGGLLICAPVKDMDMTGMTIEEGYKIVNIPELVDPVVLRRLVGGFLILSAWGDEASDPLVVNEINN